MKSRTASFSGRGQFTPGRLGAGSGRATSASAARISGVCALVGVAEPNRRARIRRPPKYEGDLAEARFGSIDPRRNRWPHSWSISSHRLAHCAASRMSCITCLSQGLTGGCGMNASGGMATAERACPAGAFLPSSAPCSSSPKNPGRRHRPLGQYGNDRLVTEDQDDGFIRR
jgi:hypothetical protein